MKPFKKKEKSTKKHYQVLLDGEPFAETWAVSAEKAISNAWWKYCKNGSKFYSTNYTVDDFDAVQI